MPCPIAAQNGAALLPYTLLDSGHGRKLERFGAFVLDRPCAVAPWQPSLPPEQWQQADGVFSREGGNHWAFRRPLPQSWPTTVGGLKFLVEPTDFGHVGLFPEHSAYWPWIGDPQWQRRSLAGNSPVRVLNLFAYTGGATLAAARIGAEVCHVDASPKSINWARENAASNGFADAPIRWIAEDVRVWLRREIRRERHYAGIVLDPPSFGRGKRAELFKIESHLRELLQLCREVLQPHPFFLVLSCHTPGYTPQVLANLLTESMAGLQGDIAAREMILPHAEDVLPVPAGACAMWHTSSHAFAVASMEPGSGGSHRCG